MSKHWLLIASFAIVFSFTAYGQNYNFQGIVRDSETQKAIEGVMVEALPLEHPEKEFIAITGTSGSFSLNLATGNYLVSFRALGYEVLGFEISIDSDMQKDFVLQPQPISLGEVVVSSFRVNRKVKELPTSMAVVSSRDYQSQSAYTLSNVLSNEPGIAMGSDGVWATNINIRGLNENRLVTLIDGNRVETATDLTAALSMVDVNDIDRVEVVKGAQSSLYGSGAMGGIVNIITKDGNFSTSRYFSGGIISGFSSANELYNGYLTLNAGADNWYVKTSGNYTDANDIRTPEGILPNSQFTANNVSTKIGFKPKDNHLLKVQFQRYWASNVGIPGGDAFPGPATATYSDIGRQLFSASYEFTDITDKLTSVRLNYFNQYILRDVELLPNIVSEVNLPSGYQRVTPLVFTPRGEHLTQGAQLQSTWSVSSKNTIIAGIDMWQRRLETKREKNIRIEVFSTDDELVATNSLVRGETPIPLSTFGSAGLFVQNEFKLIDERLTLILGGRFDGIKVDNEEGYDIDYLILNGDRNDTPPNQRITFAESTESNYSWSANFGTLFSVVEDIDLSFNMARSYRAPSLEERFKYIDLGNMVRLGDPTLNPESGYSIDFGVRVWKPTIALQIGAFSNWLDDMIVETPGEFIYTINTGPQEGVIDTIPALINANVSKAQLYGADVGFQYNVSNSIVILGSAAYVIGKNTEDNSNLPQIPPLNGKVGVRYNYPKIGTAQLVLVGAAQQDKIAEGENVTEGFHRWDLAISSPRYSVGLSNIQLFAGIDNLTDVSYTNHLATNRGAISIEPGRNIYLRVNLSF